METGLKSRQVFKLRTISTVIGVPLVAALIWFGSPWFTALAVAWAIGAVLEFYRIVGTSLSLRPLAWFGALWTALFIIQPHFPDILPVPLLLTSGVVLSLVILLFRRGKENAFAGWAWTIGGILYIGWLLSYFVALRNIPADGRGWVFLAMLCTFASDICAYLVGRSLGRHKMAPYVSPNKTWEGAVGGVVGAVLISLAVTFWFGLPVSRGGAVLLGIIISVIGQLGDLVKSLFKRNMAVKDSGKVVPGHGGFLDRMDSLAFAGVAVYYYVIYLVN